MTWDRDAEEYACEHELALCKIVIDGKYRPTPSGVFEYTGAIPEKCREELRDLLRSWVEKGYLG